MLAVQLASLKWHVWTIPLWDADSAALALIALWQVKHGKLMMCAETLLEQIERWDQPEKYLVRVH